MTPARRFLTAARRRLSYATVVSAISAFLLLAGGAALAAGQLGKNSVGTSQLRKNSVTAAKIKANAVTASKFKKSAVTGAKFKAGAVGAASLELESTPYAHTIHVVKAGAQATTVGEDLTPIPLEGATFSQQPGEDYLYVGEFTGTFPAECQGPERNIFVGIYLDSAEPSKESRNDQILGASFRSGDEGRFTATVPLGPNRWSFQPAAAVNHSLSALGDVHCDAGVQTGVIESVRINVVAVR